jgi:hypothetical protein
MLESAFDKTPVSGIFKKESFVQKKTFCNNEKDIHVFEIIPKCNDLEKAIKFHHSLVKNDKINICSS